MKFFISSLLCCVLGLLKAQDCNIQITVPDDVTLCKPGYVQLQGAIDGSYFGFDWSGSNGYFNILSLNDQVWVDETTTFTLSAYGQAEENLIQNPSFEDGNTGFSTLYTYNPVSLWSEGTYTVTNNPNSVHSGFTACAAHEGTQMMVLNGSVSLAQIWCQSIPVTPNTNYVFWAWATSVNPSNPARLQFSINNNLIGQQLHLTGTLCQWQQFYAVWNSGNQTTADICIVNQNTNPSGNDFALDDLFFGPLCETEESFTVLLEEFEIIPEEVPPITCFDPEQIINALTEPPMTGLEYEWSTWNGSILSDPYLPDIVAGSAGTYSVTVTSANQCTRTLDFEVTADNEVPDVGIYGNPVLDCNELTSYIEAFTFGNTEADFYWDIPGQSNYNGPGFYVNTPGVYTVTATAPNGCSDTASIEIILQNNSFLYSKQVDGPLTCAKDSVAVFIENQSDIDSIAWLSDSGQPVWSSFDTLWLHEPGVYHFTLREGKYCMVADSIFIDSLPALHQFTKVEPDTITCKNQEVTLRLEDTLHVDRIYWFYHSDLISDKDTARAIQAGVYYVMVYDSNQCVTTDSVLVLSDLTQPDFQVRIDSIDCQDNAGGFITEYTGFGSIEWFGPSGQSTDKNPVFTQEGEYVLKVTAENGCQKTDTFYLPSSRDYPSIAAEVIHIDCRNPVGSITISTSRPASIHWTGPDGNTSQSTQIQSAIAGLFTIEAVTAQGCMAEYTVALGVDTLRPYFNIQRFDTITCAKPVVVANVNASAFDSLIWKKEGIFTADTLFATFAESGLYTLALYNRNGCFTEKSLEVFIDTISPSFTAQAEDLSCAKSSTMLNLSGAQNYTYYSAGQVINSGHVIQNPGWYSISASGKNGCRDSVLIEIKGHFERHDIGLDTVLLNCRQPVAWVRDYHFTDTVMYRWILPAGTIVSDSLLVSKNQGDIVLQAINGFGCITEKTLPVKEDFTSPGVFITGSPEIDCVQNKTVLYAGSNADNAEFFWSGEHITVQKDTTIEITLPGWYRLIAENPGNGCSDTTDVDVVLEKKPESVAFAIDKPICAEDEATVILNAVTGGNAPYEIYIDTVLVSMGTNFSLPGTKIYAVKVIDSHACVFDTSFMVSYPAPLIVDAGKDTTVLYGEEISLRPSCSAAWDSLAALYWSPSAGLNCENCPFPVVNAEKDDWYYIHVTDVNGCARYDSVLVRVKRLNGYDAPNVIQPSSSVNGRFTIYSLYNSVEVIEHLGIYDRWGNLVFHVENIPPDDPQRGWDGTFHNNQTSPGVYVWVAKIRYKTGAIENIAGDILVMY